MTDTTDETKGRVGRLCVLRDRDPWFKPDDTGFNKVGYLRSDGKVVYPVRRHFVEKDLAQLTRGCRMDFFQSTLPTSTLLQIDTFFSENVLNPDLMKAALRALTEGDTEFFKHPVKLPKLKPISLEQRARRFEQLGSVVRGGDLIFVLDQQSWLSRLIARVDQGTWSHCGILTGYGTVQEQITSGMRERPVSVYADPRYRIGVYRAGEITEGQLLSLLAHGWSRLGSKYGWLKAARLGFRKVLRMKSKYDVRLPSPNDLIAWSSFRLVHIV